MSEDASEKLYWKAKVAAWVHDPPEKALILFRTWGGHEAGTVHELCQQLFGTAGIPQALSDAVRRADRWASAADRPDRPRMDGTQADRVKFYEEPCLIHPLSGEKRELRPLSDQEEPKLRATATAHLSRLIMRSGEAGPVDWKRTFLSLWRYAPEAPNPSLGALWRLLPADTRVPDHSIWEHLSLTSAFAGIFATNEEPALLALSLGPVQSFIAQARSTSDLWAGSHLLSTLSWEALRILADELGPDCVLLPNLHGLPVADVWLAKDLEVKPYWDQNAEPDDSDTETGADVEAPLCADLDPAPWRPLWRRRRTDANPLFVAAIPNRLVALVPATRASSIAERIRRHLREFLQDLGHRAWCKILEASAREATDTGHGSAQIARQLAELPELAWAAVPWSLVAGRAPLDVARLRDALAAFYPPEDGAAPGFLGSEAWKRFARQEIPQFSPNPGFLYPALYDLLDRALAASKATRPFAPAIERGFRCSLCGEREWLALSEDPLVNALPRGEAHRDDPWPAVAKKRPSWARRTEHLCAVCTTKRLWPSLFEEDLKKKGIVDEVRRYVVSTHALAVASSLARLCDGPVDATRIERLRTITSNVGETVGDLLEDEGNRAIALPRRLAARVAGLDRRDGIPLRDVPALLDELGDALRAIPTDGSAARGDRDVRSRLLKARDDFENALRGTDALGGLEDYYALVLMDGDRMGAWLSSLGAGDGALGRPRYEELWHPRIRNAALEEAPALQAYYRDRASPSPAYHAAVSRALGDLALDVLPTVVEEEHLGKIIYAGGDDLLAMVSVTDLLSLLARLREVYRGEQPANQATTAPLKVGSGHVLVNAPHKSGRRRLLRVMGNRATISVGAVVAHHMTPLAAVLSDLRAAEGRAKQAGRDAVSITLAKRSGGTTHITVPYVAGREQTACQPLRVIERLRGALSNELSRRAAYHLMSQLPSLPSQLAAPELQALLGATAAYQLQRQSRSRDRERLEALAALGRELVATTVVTADKLADANAGGDWTPTRVLEDWLRLAEFLARTERADGNDQEPK